MKKYIILAIITLLAIGFGGVVGYLLGREGSSGRTDSSICQEYVARYNTLYAPNDVNSNFSGDAKDLYKIINERRGHMDDATCNMMMAWLALSTSDVNQANTYVSRMKEDTKAGRYPSNELVNIMSPDGFATMIKAQQAPPVSTSRDSLDGSGL